MDSIFRQVTSYRLFNHFLPGTIFCIFSDYALGTSFNALGIIETIVAYYVVGLILSSIGAIIVEPLSMFTGIIPKRESYTNFVKSSKEDAKLDVLVEEANMFRTLCSTLLCGLILLLINFSWPGFMSEPNSLVTVALIILLPALSFASWRKQSFYVTNRVKSNTEEQG